MSEKKYAGLNTLSFFLEKCKTIFATLTHKHTISDITDYKVDTALSSTSTNPIQNKVINAEFDAVSEAMGALESAIDEKLDTSTASSTYETKEDTQLKYDEITDAKADWNQNDENAIDYVKNRTHWVDTEMVEIIPEQSVTKKGSWDDFYQIDLRNIGSISINADGNYIVKVNGKNYICKAEFFGGENFYMLGNAEMGGTDPFSVEIYDSMMVVIWKQSLGETITLAIYEEQGVVKQLDEKFIPNSIARTSDIKNIDLSSYETTTNAQTKYDNAVAHSDANLETAKNYTDTVASGKASSSHTHDNMYYTEAEMDSKLSAKSDKTHNHDTVYDTKGSAKDALTEAKEYTDTVASGKANTSHSHSIGDISNLQSSLDAKVPTSRTVNGKALSANITLSASDVGADASGSANSALSSAKSYTDTKISTLINSAPTTLDTLGEIATAMQENESVVEALEDAIGTKANAIHSHAISDVTDLQTTLDGKAAKSHGTHVSWSTTSPKMDGTASVGSETKVARGDHVHPTDTSRASKTEFDSHASNTTKHITSTERTNWGTAYTHSQAAHAPSNAQANQNAFSNIKVGDTTIAADTTTDTLTLEGSNVTITPDATNDKVTIAVASSSTSTAGIVKLTNSTSSTSTTTAATPNSVKSAYDLANTAKTNAATAQTRADSAYTLAESKVDSLSDLGITATTDELNYVDGVTSNIQTQLDGKSLVKIVRWS